MRIALAIRTLVLSPSRTRAGRLSTGATATGLGGGEPQAASRAARAKLPRRRMKTLRFSDDEDGARHRVGVHTKRAVALLQDIRPRRRRASAVYGRRVR